ncbi:MAG: hypothetical protein CL840_06650 [Crocinitomicaceae bacterium]|nr:hypothetical protein [Crocinitomicaceae bacterium]|tara:strand:+ start:2401 stop:2781 length:381 start_codon:yes stop_codon:yes gene_type:complete
MAKEKIELEFEIRSAPGILYNRLVTPSGLSEWFADNVMISEELYTFVWDGAEEDARLLIGRDPEFVRFQWAEEDDPNIFFEFRIRIDDMTGDVALIVTDFVDEDEVEEATNLWEKQVSKLKMILGS